MMVNDKSQLVNVPMESYRLARYAVQIPCYICEGENAFDSELCRHCYAPMALAHQANSQKIRPQLIAVIGTAGVGKTVYLGMLIDMLSRETEGLRLLARGAFSINLQQNTIGALARCQFPDKTPNDPDRWNWVHCQVHGVKRRRPVEVVVPDVAGEAILEEIDHPHTYPAIRSLLQKASGALVLFDTPRLEAGIQGQDFFALKLMQGLSELIDDRKTGWNNRPLAMVFSKSDECEPCIADPTAYAQRRIPAVAKLCQERMRAHQFFACGVAGATTKRVEGLQGTVDVPLRVEPRGLVEPFQWLMNRIH